MPIVQTHINNHANALLDLEFKKTDTLAVWLPDGADKVGAEFCFICCATGLVW